VAGPAKAPSQIRLLLVEDVGQVTRYIRGVLNAQTAVKLLDVVSDGATVIEQIREQQPDVLVVDALLTGRQNGLQVAESVRRAGIDLPIIVLTVPQKPVVVGGGMGIARVLEMPFSGFEFMNMLQAVTTEHRASSPESLSRVIAFHGAKGGLGTTTIAYNVAVAMAKARRFRVLLVDGNLQYSDLRSLLQVPPETHSVVDLPTDRLTQAEISEAIYTDPNGLDILFGPPRIEDAEMINVRDVEKLFSLLRRMYNVVLVDTPRNVNEVSLAYFDTADLIVQVTTGEVAALSQTALMNSTFQAIGYGPEKVHVLLNRFDAQGMLDDKAIRQYLGRPVEYKVGNDFKLVVEANNRGQSLVAVQAQAKVAHHLSELAQSLTEALPTPPPRPVLA
jgi:pilus assembly protein CpaE